MRKFLVLMVSAFLVGLVLNPVAAQAATKRTISIKTSKSSVHVGAKFNLTGKVTKSPKGTKVTIQRKSGSSAWKNIKTVKTTNKSGSFKLNGVKIGGKGTFKYRAKVKKTKKLKAATSKATKVKASYAVGTRQNPAGLNKVVKIADWSVSVGATNKDAFAVINQNSLKEYGSLAEPPNSGNTYIAVPVTAKYNGKTKGTGWLDVSIHFLGSDGRVYDDFGGDCWVMPKSWWDVADLYPGAVGAGNACLEVPSHVISGGKWRVHSYDSNWNRHEAFFKLN